MKITKVFNFILNAYLALVLFLFIKRKRNIWLVGGHAGNLYTDNAKVFYEYMLNTYPDIEIYWIINKNAPHKNIVKGNTIVKGSIKNYYYFYNSEVVLFSDTLNLDIAPYSFILPFIRRSYTHTLKVYLGHGTIALKKMPVFKGFKQKIKREIFKSYDIAIASTNLEAKVMHNSYSIKKSSIYLVGSARNDTLENINSNKEVILVAPTWRIWLKDLESLQNTDFFQSYVSVLTNENLCNYLEENNIYIHFYLHHMFHRFIDDFLSLENKVIKILPVNANISLEIKSSQMLITDYSSICSDFYYLKKPVLFYQFDRGEYIQKIGSEIDLTLDEFGNVYCDKKELLEGILHTLKEQYKLSKKQLAGESFFVNFQDQKNCKRIYGIIESILKSKVESHMDIKFNH